MSLTHFCMASQGVMSRPPSARCHITSGVVTKLATGLIMRLARSISGPGTMPSADAMASASRWRGSVQRPNTPGSEKSTGVVSATRLRTPSGRSAAWMTAMVPPMQ